MAVSSGSLDSLVKQTFGAADYSLGSIQSVSTIPNDLMASTHTYNSITVDDTGTAGDLPNETINIVAVNDTTNAITFNVISNGQVAVQETDIVVGFGTNSLLLYVGPSAGAFAFSLDGGAISELNPTIDVLSFSPIGVGTSLTFTPTGNTTPAVTPPTVLDTTTHQAVTGTATAYSGPVAGLTSQYIDITTDSLNITTITPNWFIASGSGNDAINVSQGGGNNILDGGTGSNFLTGGSGDDTFYLDNRNPTAPIFSTIANFHSGDNVTGWGVNPTDFTMLELDNQGAAGFTGLDLLFTAPGHTNTSFVLAGYTSADLINGKLSLSYGTTADLPGLPDSQYLTIHAN